MPHYTTSVSTSWSPDQAFDYLSDLEHFADWDPGVKRSVHVTETGSGLGAAYDVTVGGIGRDMTLRYVVVGTDRPHRLEIRADTGSLVSVDVMTFEADGRGCVVTYDADLSLKGAFK